MTRETDPAPPRATRREWIGLATLSLACMLYSMDLTVLNLALPELARTLRPTASQLLWIVDIYGFMVAGFLIIMGSLGDRFGRRRVLLIGAAAFGLASAFAAFAETAETLIVARALLGIAGATIGPSTLSLISSMFRDPGERTFAISLWIMSFSVGAIIGPVAGGVLIEAFWWGAVFLACVPIMLALLVLGPLLLPEYRDPLARPIDARSALLSLAAVLAVISGVKRISAYGADAWAVAAIAAGLALGAVFFRRQRRLANPFVDMALFARPVFAVSIATNALAVFFLFGAFVLTAQYLQLVAGLTPLEAGLWSLPGALAFAAVSPFTAALVRRFSAHRVMAGGLAGSGAGFAMLAVSTTLPEVVLANTVIALGITPVATLTTGFIVGSAPVAKAGVASALSETAAELGGALGIALLGSLMTFVYVAAMADAATPGLAPEAAAAARATLAGAVDAAAGRVDADALALLATARSSFLDALTAVGALGAATLGLLAVQARRTLKHAALAEHG